MKYNILHIILPAMMLGMVWAAASCTSAPDPDTPELGEEIRFDATEGPASRASVTNNSNLTAMPFMLFGGVYRTGEFYQGFKVIFEGDKVSYTGSEWSYEIPIYWLMGQEHSFVALHPALESGTEITDMEYADSKLSFTYTVPKIAGTDITDYTNARDLLVATHRRKYNMNNSGPVKFEFRHLLAQINIAPALSEVLMYPNEDEPDKYPDNKDEYIQLIRFEIHGLKTKADFTFTANPIEEGTIENNEWTGTYEVDDNSLSVGVLDFKEPRIITNDSINVPVCNDKEALLVLPQEIDPTAKLILYYSCNSDHTVNEPIRKIIFPLADLPIKKFEIGKIYTYKFTIEKAYTGQIKPGSLKWEINDRNLPEANKIT